MHEDVWAAVTALAGCTVGPAAAYGRAAVVVAAAAAASSHHPRTPTGASSGIRRSQSPLIRRVRRRSPRSAERR